MAGIVSLTEALDLTTPAGRAMAGLLALFAEFEREILWERTRSGLAHARENGKQLWVGRQLRPFTLRKSGGCIVLVLANPRSIVECRSGAPQSAESWERSHEKTQARPWYYYLESRISFPFQAKCLATKVVSPLRKGEAVNVVGMAPDEVCDQDMLVLIRWQGRPMAIPLAQLTAVDPDESTAEAVGDWHYWVAQGYCP